MLSESQRENWKPIPVEDRLNPVWEHVNLKERIESVWTASITPHNFFMQNLKERIERSSPDDRSKRLTYWGISKRELKGGRYLLQDYSRVVALRISKRELKAQDYLQRLPEDLPLRISKRELKGTGWTYDDTVLTRYESQRENWKWTARKPFTSASPNLEESWNILVLISILVILDILFNIDK